MAWLNERSRNGGIDEITLPTGSGRLWLCGKHFVGPDPEAALERTGADAIVCLVEPYEIDKRYPEYVQWLRDNRPERAIPFPIPDLHALPLDRFQPLLDDVLGRFAQGQGVIVHCGAGIGRAGTVGASLLVSLGAPLDQALAHLADVRPMCGPQSREQMEFLEQLAAAVAAR